MKPEKKKKQIYCKSIHFIEVFDIPCGCCLHELLVRPVPVLVEEAIESLLIDPGLWELHLGVLAVGGVYDGGAANLKKIFLCEC